MRWPPARIVYSAKGMANQIEPRLESGTLETLFRHNAWANALLFERCAALSDAQLDASIIGAYGSIRDTLIHIANSERSYLHRITTGKPYRRPEGAPAPSIAMLQESVRSTGEAMIIAAPKVQPGETVVVDWQGTPRSVPSAILLTQAINHATEHRAQIMATLTQLGIQPPDLDGWTYFAAGAG